MSDEQEDSRVRIVSSSTSSPAPQTVPARGQEESSRIQIVGHSTPSPTPSTSASPLSTTTSDPSPNPPPTSPPLTQLGDVDEQIRTYHPVQIRDALARFIQPWDATRRSLQMLFNRNHRLRPGFATSWVDVSYPGGIFTEAEFKRALIHSYRIEDTGPEPRDGCTVELVELPNATATFYRITPDAYHLSIQETELIEDARTQLIKSSPERLSLSRMDQTRHYVREKAYNLIDEIAERKKFLQVQPNFPREMRRERIQLLAKVLSRYTTGLGLVEYLLMDDNIEDIYIDAPASQNPVHLTYSTRHFPADVSSRIHDKCVTNIILGEGDADSLLARFRYESGRPFSEAQPVLETDLEEFRTRVTVIGSPLSPGGVAMALRRHGAETWTLTRLVNKSSMNPLAAGLISFLLDGRATMLVAGSRGAGKSSMLSAIMLEFPQTQRILTIEDTLELPVPEMQRLGYKVQPMFVAASFGQTGSQMDADDALRVSLRLGESVIVLGEVRGQEARTLYEAMRTGTAGSSVLGTFHADSAQSVMERVVNDIGISPVSFQATDVVVIAGLSKPLGQQKQLRRTTQVAETYKVNEAGDGEELQIGFQDLLTYDPKLDQLVATPILWDSHSKSGSSQKIAKIAKEQNVEYVAALRNIGTRAIIRKILVEGCTMTEQDLTSPEWLVQANNKFWGIGSAIVERDGALSHGKLLEEWLSWFRSEAPDVDLSTIDCTFSGVGLNGLTND